MKISFNEKVQALRDMGYNITKEEYNGEQYWIVSGGDERQPYNFAGKPGTAQVEEMFNNFYKQSILNLVITDNKINSEEK